MIPQALTQLPCWRGEIAAEPLTGGLSNEIWKVRDAKGQHVVRFGHDYTFHHVSREREVMTARAAHAAGFAPEVEHAALGVMVSQFIEARTWGEADLRAEPQRVATLLRAFHHRMPQFVSGPGFMFWVFHVIRDYARTLRTGSSPFSDRLDGFVALAAEMETVQTPLPVVFGHNDLLPANFLDDGQRLWLIDFEYAGFSTAMFDLAGAASNSGMNEEQTETLLAAYFGHEPDAGLRRSMAAMQVASLLREAMWAMVSQLYLSAPGVDYEAYANENLQRLAGALDQYRNRYGKPPA